MRRLKIAYVSDALNGGIGGGVVAGRYVVEKLREHHDVVEVGVDAEGPGAVRTRGWQLPMAAMRENDFVMALPVHRDIALALRDVDIVHLQFPFWLSFAAMREAEKVGRPVVAAFHIQPENILMNLGFRSHVLVDAMYRGWVKHYYNRADAVICPTRFAERQLVEHGLTSASYVISNGVPPDVRPQPRSVESGHEGEFTVLMVGRLAAEKRQEDLIEAVRHSKHAGRIRLILAGAGPRQHDLERLTRVLPNGAEIGFIPRNRLLRLLSSADLFVHCSEVELEGIAVIEALSMGLPALVAQSPDSAASEFALDDDFRFPVGDTKALGARLDALIEHPQKLAGARERARAVSRELEHGKSIDRLLDVYCKVIDARRVRAA
jgi:1,2-diacylglycerol 3-alpha-glucosyltransferase